MQKAISITIQRPNYKKILWLALSLVLCSILSRNFSDNRQQEVQKFQSVAHGHSEKKNKREVFQSFSSLHETKAQHLREIGITMVVVAIIVTGIIFTIGKEVADEKEEMVAITKEVVVKEERATPAVTMAEEEEKREEEEGQLEREKQKQSWVEKARFFQKRVRKILLLAEQLSIELGGHVSDPTEKEERALPRGEKQKCMKSSKSVSSTSSLIPAKSEKKRGRAFAKPKRKTWHDSRFSPRSPHFGDRSAQVFQRIKKLKGVDLETERRRKITHRSIHIPEEPLFGGTSAGTGLFARPVISMEERRRALEQCPDQRGYASDAIVEKERALSRRRKKQKCTKYSKSVSSTSSLIPTGGKERSFKPKKKKEYSSEPGKAEGVILMSKQGLLFKMKEVTKKALLRTAVEMTEIIDSIENPADYLELDLEPISLAEIEKILQLIPKEEANGGGNLRKKLFSIALLKFKIQSQKFINSLQEPSATLDAGPLLETISAMLRIAAPYICEEGMELPLLKLCTEEISAIIRESEKRTFDQKGALLEKLQTWQEIFPPPSSASIPKKADLGVEKKSTSRRKVIGKSRSRKRRVLFSLGAKASR